MKKKTWIILVSCLLVAVLIIIAIVKKKSGVEINVSTEKVEKRTIVQTVSANGKIQPENDVKISPYISGEVVQLYVKEGDRIKAGDLLAKIDPEIYVAVYDQSVASLNTQKANLSNAEARTAQVNAQYENARVTFDRQKKLFDQGVISQADYDVAKANFEVAKAQLESAQQDARAAEYMIKNSEAALKRAKDDLTRTTIVAPGDGRVSRLSVEKGERVTGASQFSSGTEIMRISNLNEMEALVEVSESDIIRVKLGDTALIEVDAYLNRKFKGVVREIATSANTVGTSADQVTNFNVKIHLLKDSYQDLIPKENPEYSPFRPGMSCTVDIQTRRVEKVLSIPIQAVTTRTEKDSTEIKNEPKAESSGQGEEMVYTKTNADNQEVEECIYIFENGIAKMQKVKTGIQDNTYIEIIEGVKEGDEIITAPYTAVSKKLKDKDKVKKVDKKELFTKE
ncbi:MAG: efflux RND transporter periplasmic adaptor subunit [Bacteroidetes bacterium]|nr:efflux RND transporter periplasmic adaptor subunit [Bacteroidota bacterium]